MYISIFFFLCICVFVCVIGFLNDFFFFCRYSNRSCELLTFDIAQINDALASNEAALNKLYNFLNTGKNLNPLLASFFSKTMGLLIIKKTESVRLLEF